MIGRGPHGEYLTGATGDWNDFSTEFNQMTESDLVTAQAAYIYPRLALVADAIGDHGVRRAAARPRARARPRGRRAGQLRRRRRLVRARLLGLRQIGAGSIYEEPQPWALLAGRRDPAPGGARWSPPTAAILVGVGAPARPGSRSAPRSPRLRRPRRHRADRAADQRQHRVARRRVVRGQRLDDVGARRTGRRRARTPRPYAWDEFTAQHARDARDGRSRTTGTA